MWDLNTCFNCRKLEDFSRVLFIIFFTLKFLEPGVFGQICAHRQRRVRPLCVHPDPAGLDPAAEPHPLRQQQRVQAPVEQRQHHLPQLRPCQVKDDKINY